jgi:hypothetical protein
MQSSFAKIIKLRIKTPVFKGLNPEAALREAEYWVARKYPLQPGGCRSSAQSIELMRKRNMTLYIDALGKKRINSKATHIIDTTPSGRKVETTPDAYHNTETVFVHQIRLAGKTARILAIHRLEHKYTLIRPP